MTELFNIFITFFISGLMSLFPLNINSYKNFTKSKENTVFDVLAINLLINLIVLFFLSFSSINLSIYFILIIILSLIFNLFFFFRIKNYLNNFLNINFLFFIILNFIIFVNLAGNPTMTWDGLENWFFKAQNFFYDYNFFDLNNIRGINYYPHFGGILWGVFWKNSVLQYEYFGRLIYVYIFLLSIFSVSDLLKKDDYVKPILISLITLICYDRFLFGGYQEVLLFSFLIFLSKYFYLYFLDKDKKFLFLCFLILNILPWIKNEGYLLVGVFLASLIFFLKKLPNKIEIIIFITFTVFLVLIKNYIFIKYLNFNPTHGANLNFSIDTSQLLNFISSISLGFLVVIFKYKIWLFLICSFYFLINNKKMIKLENEFFHFMIINLILYFSLILIIYFGYIDEPRGINWWIDNSLDRILYAISGFFIISIILLINFKRDQILK